MPAKHSRKQDPFARINAWDDGFGYTHERERERPPSPPASYEEYRTRRPQWDQQYESYPPPGRDREPRSGRRDRDPYSHAYPSPPDSSDGPTRRRRHQTSSPPPPYRSHATRDMSPPRRPRHDMPPPTSHQRYARSPSPPAPRRARPRYDDDLPRRSKSAREVPTSRRYSPSPDRNRARRHYSPSPVRHSRTQPPRAYTPPPSARRPKAPAASPGGKKAGGFAGLSPRWQQAAAAALQAGSMAAINMRSQPGAWGGEKGARVATAALGAAAMNALKGGGGGAGKNKHAGAGGGGAGSKTRSRKSSGVEALGGMLGGFLADQFVNKGGDKKGRRY